MFARFISCFLCFSLVAAPTAAVYPGWILVSSPWHPTSNKDCQEISDRLGQYLQDLNQEHEACLNKAPRDEHGRGKCSKASCQGLHDDRDKVSLKLNEETRVCRERLQAYLDEKRREQVQKRQHEAEEEADHQRRQAENDRREREDQAQRERWDREKRNRAEKRDMERRDKDAHERREREERDERDHRVQKAEAEALRRAHEQGAAGDARERARLAVELARQQEERAAEQRKRDSRDQSLYDKLVKDLRAVNDTKEALSTSLNFIKNPFRTAAELATDKVNEELVGATVERALLSKAGRDSRYELTSMVVDSARSRALSGNPFAEKISGVAMGGIHKIHGKMLGELDSASEQVGNFGNDAGGQSPSAGSTFRPSPIHSFGGNESAATVSYPSSNPFASATVRYEDPDTHTTLEIPTGYVLYRAPNSGQLTVVNYATLSAPPATGDNPELGEKGCGATGVGVVTPVCEKKRRQQSNPFLSR